MPIIKKEPNPIDVHVGSRVRMHRLMISMGQETLGKKLGLTFQQVQKYEKGANRISASRLQHIAEILGVKVSTFFEGAPSHESGAVEQSNNGELNGEETQFVSDLRKLTPSQREMIKITLNGFVAANKQSMHV